jgi:superfamily I DNA/RNA helicase
MLTFVAGQIRKAQQSARSLDAINLMTIHKAKGLEWPCVFIVGFAMNLLPKASGYLRDQVANCST